VQASRRPRKRRRAATAGPINNKKTDDDDDDDAEKPESPADEEQQEADPLVGRAAARETRSVSAAASAPCAGAARGSDSLLRPALGVCAVQEGARYWALSAAGARAVTLDGRLGVPFVLQVRLAGRVW